MSERFKIHDDEIHYCGVKIAILADDGWTSLRDEVRAILERFNIEKSPDYRRGFADGRIYAEEQGE
jgi:hypothetical protein